jgi:hypothetical protein
MENDRRGTVYIGPSAFFAPDGRMVDPATSLFWVSWQGDDRVLEDGDIHGAEAAIAWGRERSDYVMIRLGHRGDTFFSAGTKHPPDNPDDPYDEPLPIWPPSGPPPEGWYTPTDDEAF